MQKIPPRIDEFLLIAGAYRMDTFRVCVTSESTGVIRCERSGINQPEFKKEVSVNWFERRQGMSLEDKLTEVAMLEKDRMKDYNAVLKKRKQMEHRIQDRLK